MTTSSATLPAAAQPRRAAGPLAALSAAAVTIPHAIGLGLIAFGPLAADLPLGAMALWSAALPGAVLTLFAPRSGVVYAPTTVVALVYAAVMLTVSSAGSALGLGAAQVLAVCGVTVALAFAFQWLFGALGLASLARFLPISVTHGFAAGVGVSMIVSQVRTGFGAGAWTLDLSLLAHAGVAAAVVVLARGVQRRWPHLPGLLPAVVLVTLAVSLSGLSPAFKPAVDAAGFSWPPLPDWSGVPWFDVLKTLGLPLVSLAFLTAIVNSLDVVVFNQELELDHGLRGNPNQALRRESLVGLVCGLCGLIPASTSASRSRIAMAQAGAVRSVGPAHALIMLAVAVTGALWLPWVPMACLAGALILAGITQVPQPLWSMDYLRSASATWIQSWLVATIFVVSGGAGALVAGLVVATFVLLHASASTAVRRVLLDGQLRSRRLRRAAADAWLAPRMQTIAVVELQGVMSFGVAAHMAEQVRQLLTPRHVRLILDASRVAAWDATALARLRALVRDLGQTGVRVVASALDARSTAALDGAVRVFADLDRALEWAEGEILDERTVEERLDDLPEDRLGEIGEGMSPAGRSALESLLVTQEVEPDGRVFAAGDTDTDILIVQTGQVTLCTAWPPAGGLRLATVSSGMAFGEMAFLNAQPRSAFAGADGKGALLVRLARSTFDAWATQWPADALVIMGNLAHIGTRRLAATTRQLRAVLE